MTLPSTAYPTTARQVSGSIEVYNTDVMLLVNTSSGPASITMPEIPSGYWNTTYKLYVIDISGNAATNNIVINAGAGQVIDNASSITISENSGYVMIQISGNSQYITTNSSSGGGPSTPFEGTNWSFVYGNSTHSANGTQLSAAYAAAKLKTPNGSPLSATNRFTIYVGAGYYTLSSDLTLDTAFIDIVSLSGNRDVVLNGVGTINITSNNVRCVGIDTDTKAFTVATNLANVRLENCKGGDDSFASGVICSGTYINCEGGVDSFGGGAAGTASGTFTNCLGGSNSYGGLGGTASGTFTECEGGQYSFGGGGGTASGTFINCVSYNYSFGGGGAGIASGTFIGCRGLVESFGGGASGLASGTFTDCIGTTGAFGGNVGTASGTFTNCQGGDDSFGGRNGGVASGIFNHCTGSDGAFGNSTSGVSTPIFNHCVGGDESFGDSTCNGSASYCVGGSGSFAAAGTLTGKLYWCRLTAGTFATVSGGGRTIYCIDGSNNTNNQ